MKKRTLIEIEERLGIIYEDGVSNSSLPLWYGSIRHKKLSDLNEGDVIRLIRQDLYLPYILPVAFELLKDNPFAGKQFDGELIQVLSRIPSVFWTNQPNLKAETLTIVCNIKSDGVVMENRLWTSLDDMKDYEEILNNMISSLS